MFCRNCGKVVLFISWWAILILGRYPRWAFDFVSGYFRWYSRVLGYFLLLTDKYPPFSFKQGQCVSRNSLAKPIGILDGQDSKHEQLVIKRISMKGKLAFISLLLVLLLPSLVGCGVLSEFIEKTPSEIAVDTVEQYHETHVYSEYDFFVCSDMALDVWDMLKAQGIDALIQIGNVETGAENITEADHAWVLAEVSPGHYLALETTAGYAVWGKDNPLYYQGWSFDNPREYKRFVELRQEYNIRATMIEQLGEAFETSRVAGLEAAEQLLKLTNEVSGMSVLDPLLSSKIAKVVLKAKECGEYIGRCDQLTELINEQQHELENIVSEMRGLTG